MDLQLQFFSGLSIYLSFVPLGTNYTVLSMEEVFNFSCFCILCVIFSCSIEGASLSKCEFILQSRLEVSTVSRFFFCGSTVWESEVKNQERFKKFYDNIHLKIFSDNGFLLLGNVNVVFSV